MVVYPIVYSAVLSFLRWDGFAAEKPFVGFENYRYLFSTRLLAIAVKNNVLWMLLFVPIPLVIGFLLALVLQQNTRTNVLFRSMFYLPMILSFTVMSIMWSWVYEPTRGVITQLLRALSIAPSEKSLLTRPETSLIAIAIVGTPGVARLVRGLTMDIRPRDYVRAAETRGESMLYIMFVEILPNAKGPIIIDAMLRMGYAIFAMGTLGFLGLGLPPPSPDWGSMVAKGREFILAGSPWAALWPSLSIASLVVGLNLFADGLREETMRYQ